MTRKEKETWCVVLPIKTKKNAKKMLKIIEKELSLNGDIIKANIMDLSIRVAREKIK